MRSQASHGHPQVRDERHWQKLEVNDQKVPWSDLGTERLPPSPQTLASASLSQAVSEDLSGCRLIMRFLCGFYTAPPISPCLVKTSSPYSSPVIHRQL